MVGTDADEKMIVVDVPPSFPPMTRPVDPAVRVSAEEIILSEVTEEDLPDVAKGMYGNFPEWWWDKHEPLDRRPPEDVRIARMVKRLSPWVSEPGVYGIKATFPDGKFAGFAGWHSPDRPGFLCFFRHALNEELGLAEKYGWTPQEFEEMWSHVDLKSWEGEFGDLDRVRKEELGDQPHWYLSFFSVNKEFRGRGIGSKLLDYAVKQADAKHPPVPTYLEAAPNARPVYLHYGFEGVPGDDRPLAMIRRGPSQH